MCFIIKMVDGFLGDEEYGFWVGGFVGFLLGGAVGGFLMYIIITWSVFG